MIHCMSVSFCWLPLIKQNKGSTACFYDCCLFTALPGQRLTVCACKHHVLSVTHLLVWENSSQVGGDAVAVKSVEAKVWHDPLNNRCSLTHSGKHTQDATHTYPLLLTEAKSLPYIYTCTKYTSLTWPCPDNGTHLRYNLCDSGKQNRWDAQSSWISSWHWYSDLSLSGSIW